MALSMAPTDGLFNINSFDRVIPVLDAIQFRNSTIARESTPRSMSVVSLWILLSAGMNATTPSITAAWIWSGLIDGLCSLSCFC